MKMPKLKYYYMALNYRAYQDFEKTRQLLISQQMSIDITTGKVSSGIPFHFLYSKPTVADTRYRQINKYTDAVYVLKIPASIVPRKLLEPTDDPEGLWLCRANLSIEHCGVECFELAAEFEEISSNR